MNIRFNPLETNSDAYKAMTQLEEFIKNSGLDPTLYELIKLRASQMNGCAYCIDMHGNDLRKKR